LQIYGKQGCGLVEYIKNIYILLLYDSRSLRKGPKSQFFQGLAVKFVFWQNLDFEKTDFAGS